MKKRDLTPAGEPRLDFFGFYVEDWRARTSHLPREADYAYWRIIGDIFLTDQDTCEIPDDDALLMNIARATPEEWKDIRHLLIDGPRPLLQKTERGTLTNRRLAEEIVKSREAMKKASDRAAKGGHGKAEKQRLRLLEQNPSTTQAVPEHQKEGVNGCLIVPTILSPSPSSIEEGSLLSQENEERTGESSSRARELAPQQRAVGIILEAFPEHLRPHAGLAARWIEQIQEGTGNLDPIAAAETVREIVWKYPNNGADYVSKCVGTAAAKARAGEAATTTKGQHHERTGDRATRRTGSSGTPPAASKLGRFKPRDGRDV